MADKDRPKKITPPYATPAGIRLFFDLIKRVKPPHVTKKWAEDNELPFADSLVSTMKFLGAVDKDGKLQPAFAGLRLDGRQGEEALASLVRTAYKPIFDQIDDIGAASEGDLSNAFKTAWDVGAPGRYVRPFLVLCELAGLRAAPTAEDAPRRASRRTQGTGKPKGEVAPRKRTPAGGGGGGSGGGRADRAPVQVVVRLDVPWNAPIDEVRERIRAISELAPTDEG